MERQMARLTIQRMGIKSRTQLYWALSKAYRGKGGPCAGITYESAIANLSDLEEFSLSQSQKKLRAKVSNLLDRVINGTTIEIYGAPADIITFDKLP